MSPAEVEEALAAVPTDVADGWRRLSDRKRRQYFTDVRRFGGDPPELLALLDDDAHARAWAGVPWLVQRDYCRHINKGRSRAVRRWRAQGTMRVVSGEAEASRVPANGPWSYWRRFALIFVAGGLLVVPELGWWSLVVLVPGAVAAFRWWQLRRPYAREQARRPVRQAG